MTLWFAGLLACSDYGLKDGDSDPVRAPDTDLPVDTAPVEPVTCDGADLGGAWAWTASQPFATEPDPTDGQGRPFYAVDFDASGWSTTTLPERNVTTGSDKALRGRFTLGAIPPNLSLELQSDDGLWLWLNGVAVGHWGGDWQQEGCVNDDAQCLVTEAVDPVDVTSLLRVGDNVVAGRVSNPVANAWFDVIPTCRLP